MPGSEVAGPLSALAFALLGGAHCASMCGSIAGALALRADGARVVGLHHIGRVFAYVLLGTIVGAFGGLVFDQHSMAEAGKLLRGIAGGLMAAIGARLLLGFGPWAWLERFGIGFWRQTLAPLAARLTPAAGGTAASGSLRELTLGALWGFLPCGLTWTALLGAATTGSAVGGGLLLLAFGLGTLPALGIGAWLFARFAGYAVLRQPAAGHGVMPGASTGIIASSQSKAAPTAIARGRLRRRIAGMLLLAAGTWTAVVPWLGGHAHH